MSSGQILLVLSCQEVGLESIGPRTVTLSMYTTSPELDCTLPTQDQLYASLERNEPTYQLAQCRTMSSQNKRREKPLDYLVRFAQAHQAFRLAEIESLTLQLQSQYASKGLELKVQVLDYQATSPFCIIRFQAHHRKSQEHRHPKSAGVPYSVSDDFDATASCLVDDLLDTIAATFISRSIQSRAIYALWGSGFNYPTLHHDIGQRSQHLWHLYKHVAFKFSVDCFMGKRSEPEKRDIINTFAYLGFEGKVEMRRPDEEWCVMEEWEPAVSAITNVLRNAEVNNDESRKGAEQERSANEAGEVSNEVKPANLKRIFLGRKLGTSRRWLIDKHDLKKRLYISTTSMDAELALVTASLALASAGKLFVDPFCGTGGFMIAAAELGAFVLGHDIDGRSFRGKGKGVEKGVGANFRKYGLEKVFGDCFTADLVNTPLSLGADKRWLDGIIADPPYGVREGLKVLGSRKPDFPIDGDVSAARQPQLIDGVPAHTLPGFIAPKRPYSFVRLLDDVLEFAARTLADGGRLAFWMPSANENELGEEEVTVIPQHRLMELKHECVQRFNKWSRRLLVYERLPDLVIDDGVDTIVDKVKGLAVNGTSADDLNPFRRRYFQAFAGKPNG